MRQARWLPELTLASACVCIIVVSGGVPSSASWKSATLGYTLAAFTSAALIGGIFAQPHSTVAHALSWRPLVSLGRVSYGVYLFHVGIACLALELFKQVQWHDESVMRFIIATVFVLTVTWMVATLHYWYVERWFISFRASRRAYRTQPDVYAPG